jgi:hypothetical protein
VEAAPSIAAPPQNLSSSPPADQPPRWRPDSLIQIAGTLIALGLIISRRPDAITHAQFWAEDGRVFFANVYNHGLPATLATPQAGYFVTFTTLAAALAQLVSLGHAPLVMNLAAIGAQALPVALILSRRAERYAPDVRLRILFALLYVAVIRAPEVDETAVNAQWHLAVAGLLVLLAAPPRHRWQRVGDGVILVLMASTGPFCIVLLPLAWLHRRARDATSVPGWMIGILAAGAVLQLLSLAGAFSSVNGTLVDPRPSVSLQPTLHLAARILGGRVVAGTLIGEASGITLPAVLHLLVLLLAGLAVVYLMLTGSSEIRCVLLFAGALLALALLRGTASWRLLAVPGAGARYFVIPDLAVLAVLLWLLAAAVPLPIRAAAGALVVVALVNTIATGWQDPPFVSLGFPKAATAFERAPAGTAAVFTLNPGLPWTMTLVKQR